MKKSTFLLVLLACSDATAEDCKGIKDDSARLTCWDNQAKALSEKSEYRDPKDFPFGDNTGPTKQEEPKSKIVIRDKLAGPLDDGKAISFSLTTSDGEQVLKTNAAVLYDLGNKAFSPDLQRQGWSAWAGVQWQKDANSKKPVDGRLARLAALGNVQVLVPMRTMFAFEFSQDNIKKAKTIGIRPEFTPVILDLTERGTPYSAEPAYSAYLRFGAQVDEVQVAKANTDVRGKAGGLNFKTNISYYPGGAFSKLHVFLDTVRARDLYAATEIGKRSSTYYDFGAEWLFTRPDKKAGSVAPTLGLHRTIGENFLTGTSRSVQTVVSFGLKVN